jgi:hypothetical protein
MTLIVNRGKKNVVCYDDVKLLFDLNDPIFACSKASASSHIEFVCIDGSLLFPFPHPHRIVFTK